MAKKYLKNSEGIVRAVTSDNLGLEKPLLNENYNIEVHNRNMDKIDNAIQEVKGKIDGLELVASNVKMVDGTTVEDTVTTNKTSISNLQTRVDNGQNVKLTEDNGVCRGIPNNNANDIDITGFWMNSNVANAPTTGWIYLESKVHNNLFQNQVATDLHDSSKRWTRHKTSGIWSEWREL